MSRIASSRVSSRLRTGLRRLSVVSGPLPVGRPYSPLVDHEPDPLWPVSKIGGISMTGKNGLKKLLIGATVVAGLVGGAAAPAAASAAAQQDAQVRACGFWVNNQGWAFYTHCTGSVYTIVQVKVVTR